MKKITFILFFVMIGGLSFAQTVTSDATSDPANYPADMQNGTAPSTALTCGTVNELTLPSTAVTGVGTLGTTNILESVTLNVTHTWNADIVISLQDPTGAVTVLLTDDVGGNGDGFVNLVLQDGATALPTANTNPLTGTFAPLEALAGFNGGAIVADGVWNLLVCDDAAGDTGSVVSWALTFAVTPMCSTPSGATATTTSPSSADFSWLDVPTATLGFEWGILAPGGDPAVDTFLFSGSTGAGVLVASEATLSATTDYVFYVRANCDTEGFSSWSGGTTFTTPAANDDCANAVTLTVNADLGCGTVTSGTIAGATDSGVDSCGGTEDDDVWYSFVATAVAHQVVLQNITGGTTDLYHAVYDATPGCGALGAALTCSDPNTSTTSGLTIGNTYYVQVYSWTGTAGQTSMFDICIGTPPPPPPAPANDECDSAVPLTVNLDYDNTIVTAGTTVGATASAQADDVTGTPNTDVWYSFVAVYDAHRVALLNVANQGGGTSTSTDMGMGVYDATGGCAGLVFTADSDPNTLNLTGLTVGTTYSVRVYGWFSSVQYNDFDISVGSDPALNVNDVEFQSNFTYYPNPVKNTLTLNAQNTIEQVAMYNMLGQEVLRATPNTVDSDLDMSNLQTGTYFVKVTIANVTKTIRVIKQ